MGKALFPSHTFGMSFPAPFDGGGISKSRSDVKSKHRSALANVKLHAPTLRAAIGIVRSRLGVSNIAIGRQGDFILVERENSSGGIEVVAFDIIKGTFKASIFETPSSAPEAYSLKKANKDGTALLIAIMYYGEQITRDSELIEYMDKLASHEDSSSLLDDNELSKCGAVLCDNIYTRVVSADSLGSDGISVTVSSTANIQPLTRLAIDQAKYSPEEVYFGEFRVLPSDGAKKLEYKPISNTELPGKYIFCERTYTIHEQELIPTVEPWYIVPKSVVRICEHAFETTKYSQPMRNFMLRGPAGVGKTEGARAIAAALGLPYLSLTCSANTEVFDLLGQILPDVDGINGEVAESASEQTTKSRLSRAINLPKLPSFEDIQMDAATAYQSLTGIYDENISTNEVYEKLLEVIKDTAVKEVQSTSNHGKIDDVASQKFRYVETPLVKAMKYGYLIEIQEPSVIANPGVLVGLNSLLDNCKQITLPTGETIKRHPDTVVVVTTNNDYSGCRDMNQSVISRMNLVMDIDEPSIKELVTRITAITGCEDDETLTIMASVVNDVQQHCRASMITDGCCGMREFISWTLSYMITNDLRESARYTILSSASADPESRAQIWNTCVNPKVA